MTEKSRPQTSTLINRIINRIKTNPHSQYTRTLAQQSDRIPNRVFRVAGWLCLSATLLQSAAATERSGESVFNQSCFACHGTGLNGAPVVGDEYDWQDRLSKGLSVLLENTLQGMNNMPPRGACADCSDAEIAAAVQYLTGG